LELLLHLGDVALSRLARTGATGRAPAANAAPREDEVLRRLSATPGQGRAWADCAQEIGVRMRHGRSVNLDPAALVLDMVFRMQKTAGG
jgi:DNA polymerase-3 subunit delta'